MESLKRIVLLLCLLCGCFSVFAQRAVVTGVVKDESGQPVIGATVIVRNQPGLGVTTDIDGKYSIKTGPNEVLMFSFIGYKDQTIAITGKTVINVVMVESTDVLEEITVVAAGTQRKSSIVGAITTVDMKQLSIPSANLSNALAGNVGGIIAVQRSGEPGANKSEFWIRGISTFGANAQALVLVDGIERDFNEVNVEDIETFSVLKDASATAIYGQRGANGVILITTKKGEEGRVIINFKAEYGLSSSDRMPKYVNGMDYSALANEARRSRYQDPLYDEADMEIIGYNLDPDLYPNVNWYDELLKDQTSVYRAALNISGGGSTARYYISGSYNNEDGLFKTNNLNDYNTNANYKRYNFRLNVDLDITKTTILEVGLGGWVVQQSKPGGVSDDANVIWGSMANMTPTTVPIRYSNGLWPTYGKENNMAVSPAVWMMESGYRTMFENKIESNLGIRQDLEFITKGLKLSVRYSFDAYNKHNVYRLKRPALYKAERVRDGMGNLIMTKMSDAVPLYQETLSQGQRRSYLEGNLSYDRLFGKHRVGGLIFYYQQSHEISETYDDIFKSVPKRNLALSGRVTYAFDDRYFAEFNFGYTGSENFEPDNRFGFFPAIAGGWMISNEKFVKEKAPWLNLLKLRYSYGEVGNDRILSNIADGGSATRFPYITVMGPNGDYNFGNQGSTGKPGLGIASLGAAHLTWEVARKQNAGIDIGLFNRFNMTVDIFRDNRDKIFMRRGYMPGTVGLQGEGQRPWGNVGKMQSQGLDGTFSYNQEIGKVALTVRGNFTYATNKIQEYDEAAQSDFYRMTKGYRWGQNRGLISLGLFKDDQEIMNSPKQYDTELLPGDIKYKDVNGDGVVNDDDIVPIGHTDKPELIYGMGISAQWKGFDINVLFQGSGNSDFFLGGSSVYPFAGSEMGNILDVVANPKNRWISREISGDPSTERADAIFPRLSYGENLNNFRHSTYWMRSSRYLRLKNVEIGYTLPRELTRKWMMSKVRVYFIGNNLAVWDSFGWWDPELGSGDGAKYPIQRVLTFGVTVNF